MNVITDFLLTFSHLEEAEDVVDHLNCFLKPRVALAPPEAFAGNSEFGANVVLGSYMYLDQASFVACLRNCFWIMPSQVRCWIRNEEGFSEVFQPKPVPKQKADVQIIDATGMPVFSGPELVLAGRNSFETPISIELANRLPQGRPVDGLNSRN